MKWYKIWSKPKVLVKQHFNDLPPNFFKGLDKISLNFVQFALIKVN